jgi:gamma-glutamyltranspeptidase/glutathione hydrolase
MFALLAAGFAAGASAQPAPEASSSVIGKQAAVGSRFMAVAAHPLAVEAGYAVLKRGGAAIDAAVAMQFVLGLVEPQSSGIGGGAFILHYSAADHRLRAYDGRETAPAAAKPDRFLGLFGRPMGFFESLLSGKSVGVPGLLAVLELAHRNHGACHGPSWCSLRSTRRNAALRYRRDCTSSSRAIVT